MKTGDGRERDKAGRIVTKCGIEGCPCKGNTTTLKTQRQQKHDTEVKWKSEDGKESDRFGKIIRTCEIGGCAFRVGNTSNMRMHKARNQGIAIVVEKDDDIESDTFGQMIRCERRRRADTVPARRSWETPSRRVG